MYFASNVASFVCDDRVEEILWPGNIDEDELGGQSYKHNPCIAAKTNVLQEDWG